MLAHGLAIGHCLDDRLAEVLRVRAREADPVNALDGVDGTKQLTELGAEVGQEVASPRVHVLAEKRHLPDPVGRQTRDLGDDLAGPAALLLAADGGDDAVRADRVAAHGDLHPGLKGPLAPGREVAGEVAPLGEAAAIHAETAGSEPVGEVWDRAWPEGDVHVRVELEDPLALGFGVAAAHGDDALRVRLLQRRRLGQVRGEALVGLLAHRAGVEDDHVGLLLGDRLSQACRLEQALDPLGVVGVHLAPECGDVVAPHGQIVARS